ncbi:DUF6950 family protein [Kaistia sp. MMO-174]|uniref:DUF6950 family protein n=1 Tax=Kaistia sp. MMO-174 TaxID=3081256 RepID=UPI0030197A4D
MALQRIPAWRVALHEAIEAQRRLPFAWGEHDCALFASDCIRAMTGLDLAMGFRGTYRSAGGAHRALKRAGYADLVSLAAHFFDEVHPMMAGAGDIAAFDTPEGWALGVVAGERVAVLGPDGLATLDRSSAAKAFRIG